MTTAADKSAITAKLAEARSLVAALPSSGGPPPPPDNDPPDAAGTWSLRDQIGPYPFGSGCKHVTMLCVGDTLFAGFGDYGGGKEICPNGYEYVCPSNRRNVYSAKWSDPALTWKLEQTVFMPDVNGQMQCQGPRQGPDQVWFWRRTAGGRNEFYVGPGFYRTDCEIHIAKIHPYEGEDYLAFEWLRPGWRELEGQRKKVPKNYAPQGGESVFYRNFGSTNEPDKFCAYDEKTDAAYCLHDFFEVIKFDHAKGDWDHLPSGDAYTNIYSKAKDDQGRALYPANHVTMMGSFQVIIGRRLYALLAWQYRYVDRRMYLAWVDLDTTEVGAITCPFDWDVNWLRVGPGGEDIYTGNPCEHSFIVGLNGKIVLALGTYYGIDATQDEQWKWNGTQFVAGNRPIWVFDPATGKWSNAAPIPREWGWMGGNTMVAIPELNAVALMASTANPETPATGNGWNKAAFFTFAGQA